MLIKTAKAKDNFANNHGHNYGHNIMRLFLYFFKFYVSHKWNEEWLLVMDMVYTSCLASCWTTFSPLGGQVAHTRKKKKDLGSYKIKKSGKSQNFIDF